MKEEKFSGLVLNEYMRMILEHIDNKLKSVGRFNLPDMRQLWKAEEDKDPADILYLELVG